MHLDFCAEKRERYTLNASKQQEKIISNEGKI